MTIASLRTWLLSLLALIGACLFVPAAALAHTASGEAARVISFSIQDGDCDSFQCGSEAPSSRTNCGCHESCGGHANSGCCGPALLIAVPSSDPANPAEFLAEFAMPLAGVTPDLPKKPPRPVS